LTRPRQARDNRVGDQSGGKRMAESAVGKIGITRTDLKCPRDHTTMREIRVGEANLDECKQCGGRFFDQGEMFAALGLHADPSYWDRPECAGPFKDADIHCPRCDGHMLLQTIEREKQKVEIDRCGHCEGIWLDRGEAERIVAIGKSMVAVLEAERAKAQKELDSMGEVDFSPPGLIASFLALFRGE
jgi:Zn-finger nucleic acid-binding protein